MDWLVGNPRGERRRDCAQVLAGSTEELLGSSLLQVCNLRPQQ